MELTPEQRTQLGRQVESARRKYFGTKSAAYNGAGINSTTWDRIEQGLPVRDDRLSAAVKLLWPSTDGDWQLIAESEAEYQRQDAEVKATYERNVAAASQRTGRRIREARIQEAERATPPAEKIWASWADLRARMLVLEVKYAAIRGIDPNEAHDELTQLLLTAQQIKDGRPWNPPWRADAGLSVVSDMTGWEDEEGVAAEPHRPGEVIGDDGEFTF